MLENQILKKLQEQGATDRSPSSRSRSRTDKAYSLCSPGTQGGELLDKELAKIKELLRNP
jgi:hypothetical protein